MINRLINMEVTPIIPKEVVDVSNGVYTISDYAQAFINGMSSTQQERFRKMLQNGIQCGMSVADNYGVDYEQFITEVKKQMGV